MSWLRGAISFCPILGPAADLVDAASQGDRVGAAVELCNLALDVCCGHGAASLVRAGALRVKLGQVGLRKLPLVAKNVLKKKFDARVASVAVKLGVAAACALVRKGKRRIWPDLPFEGRSSREAQLHAILAREIYRPMAARRGVCFVPGCWYTYVGGDARRGFWYCPNTLHLILAERGTAFGDGEDLLRDACLGLGFGMAAVSCRARSSMRQLRQQVLSHTCERITVAGHSLGGCVAVFLAARCLVRGRPLVDAVHVFNPGGLPDLSRSLSSELSRVEVHVHRIRGDLVSAGFLPFRQTCYDRRQGFEGQDSHSTLHFVPSWHEESLLRPPSLPSGI